MKHLSLQEAQAQSKDIPEGEIVAIHELREKKSLYILTPSGQAEEFFCFGVKIRGRLYTSDWVAAAEAATKGKGAMQQILYIKRGGWYETEELKYDDLNLHKEKLFRCAYCDAETVEPRGACICRRIGATLAR